MTENIRVVRMVNYCPMEFKQYPLERCKRCEYHHYVGQDCNDDDFIECGFPKKEKRPDLQEVKIWSGNIVVCPRKNDAVSSEIECPACGACLRQQGDVILCIGGEKHEPE
jgi:hypothetical protein